MAFESNTLVNGEWTTRTLDVDTVLRHYDQQDNQPTANIMDREHPPLWGLLTQTVIRSPLVNWILPVSLRDPSIHDVAFIGDDFVQIKELRPDGLLWDVIRKENFGARIRNARIVGSIKAYKNDPDVQISSTQIKDEDDDVQMAFGDAPAPKTQSTPLLPPQFIVLQFYTGDSAFLSLCRSESGKLAFVSSRIRVPKMMLMTQPGTHLAVDPSSRYMAIGCSEGVFSIYALHSRDELKKQLSTGSDLRHVQSQTQEYFNGVIHKMEFLYPSADDENHIILLLLVVLRGKTRMMIYEWETGHDLKAVKAHSRKGHLLEESRQMPQLVIPLTIKSSFILVSENSMAICRGLLEGQPKFVDFSDQTDPPTRFHHGIGPPLWVSWARPSRLEPYRQTRDDVYIAREDGLLKFVEIDVAEEEFVKSYNNIGEFEANCGWTLASLDYKNDSDNRDGDLLIMGGDSCAGGVYLVEARKTPEFREPIQNWTPSQDFVTTYSNQDRDFPDIGNKPKYGLEVLPKPDRIFACVGKGLKGAITEFRYGLEANLGLEMEYSTAIMQAWVFPANIGSVDEEDGSLFLLSVGNCSALLHLSSDATNISELDEHSTKLDLRHRTIATTVQGDTLLQVTEKSIVAINASRSIVLQGDDLLGALEGSFYLGLEVAGTEATIEHAAFGEGIITFTTRFQNKLFLQDLTLEFPLDGLESDYALPSVSTWKVRTLNELFWSTSCLALGVLNGRTCAIIAGWTGATATLSFQPIDGSKGPTISVGCLFAAIEHDETIVSIEPLTEVPGGIGLLCGTRNGFIFTYVFVETSTTLELVGSSYQYIGATPAIVVKDEQSNSGTRFFIICDSNLHSLTLLISQTPSTSPSWSINYQTSQVWLTDAKSPGLQQPAITSVARLLPGLSGGSDGGILLVSGSQLLLADLHTQAKVVPRHISIGGTPTRLLYSQSLEVLIVAVSVKGKSTLLFIDPETGEDLSEPIDQKTKMPVEFILGLGNEKETILRLFEWSYIKDGKTWNFIIVSTNTGRLLIISIADPDSTQEELQRARHPVGGTTLGNVRPKVKYYTRYRFKCAEPVYSVIGYADGLLWCAGDKLYADNLDVAEKKFKRVAEYELPSAAIQLSYHDGTIYALTMAHSLEVLELFTSSHRETQIVRTHGDQVSRYSFNHVILDASPTIHLVSDKYCSIAGLWPTHNTKADTLDTVFEAQLPYSIARFRFGRCRPIWDSVWRPPYSSFNAEPNVGSTSITQTLGLSITGSLSHFTILNLIEFEFLKFLINLAKRSPKVCEFTYMDGPVPLEIATEPKIMMHVDGDILRRCLEDRRLEELLRIGQNTVKAKEIFNKFCELLLRMRMRSETLETAEKIDDADYLVKKAYSVLEFFLRPVL